MSPSLESVLEQAPSLPGMDADSITPYIREFAAAPPFRSATVDELTVQDDFSRRPLRPEDLEFIDFSRPVDEEGIDDLAALAANRILLCIYESSAVRPYLAGTGARAEAFEHFYGTRTRVLGEIIRPFLEHFAFSHWEERAREAGLAGDPASIRDRVLRAYEDRLRVEAGLRDSARGETAGRMVTLQFQGLLESREFAVRLAGAQGNLALPGAGAIPTELVPARAKDALARVARERGLRAEPHAHWQFYLPSTLAATNLLHALTRTPGHAYRLAGAVAFARVHGQAFVEAHLGETLPAEANGSARAGAGRGIVEQVADQLAHVASSAAAQFGPAAASEIILGFEQSRVLQELADRDLAAQVSWLRQMDDYQRLAEAIDNKIRTENISIDRETFVEPRAMCSTTHVHDDHRLVVIETGTMVFWGAPGMVLRLTPGEMTVVPHGRLHGSSVESESCTYHQPIVPASWVTLH